MLEEAERCTYKIGFEEFNVDILQDYKFWKLKKNEETKDSKTKNYKMLFWKEKCVCVLIPHDVKQKQGPW